MQDFIIIGFSRPVNNRLMSKFIRWAEKTTYSHAYVQVNVEEFKTTLVFHAASWFVHALDYIEFCHHNVIIDQFVIPVRQEEKTKILQFCAKKLGTKYGSWQLLGMGLVKLVKSWFGWKIKNPWSSGDHTVVCSEFAFDVLSIKYPELLKIDNSEIEGLKWLHDIVEELEKKYV